MKHFHPHFLLGFTPGKVPGFSTAPMAMPKSARDFFTDWPALAAATLSAWLDAWAMSAAGIVGEGRSESSSTVLLACTDRLLPLLSSGCMVTLPWPDVTLLVCLRT